MSRSFRFKLLGLTLLALVAGGTACQQKPPAIPTVAIYTLVSHPILDASIAGIKAGLDRAGYSGEKVRIVEVNANGEMDKLNGFAQQLLAAKPNIIVPVSTPVTQAVAKEAGAAQQIVFSTVTNPADVGMDRSPPNMTGVSDAVNYEANIALIQELFPKARTIGIVYNPGERNSQFGVAQVKQIAAARGLTLKEATVSRSEEVSEAARALAPNVDCFYVGSDNTVVTALAGLLRAADEKKRPVIASDQGSVSQGALAAVSVDYRRLGEKVGEIVAGLLTSGAMAGSVAPVQYLGNDLILNQAAAAKLGITFPDSVRTRASQVIQ